MVDVRSVPRSRRHPQFAREALGALADRRAGSSTCTSLRSVASAGRVPTLRTAAGSTRLSAATPITWRARSSRAALERAAGARRSPSGRRHHVRGSAVVALSSASDRRCADRAWLAGVAPGAGGRAGGARADPVCGCRAGRDAHISVAAGQARVALTSAGIAPDTYIAAREMRRLCTVLALGCLLAAAAPAHAMTFSSGHGLQVTSVKQVNSRLVALVVKTKAIPAPLNVYILFPPDYAIHPRKRFPVLYLLHGTSGGAADWTRRATRRRRRQAADRRDARHRAERRRRRMVHELAGRRVQSGRRSTSSS